VVYVVELGVIEKSDNGFTCRWCLLSLGSVLGCQRNKKPLVSCGKVVSSCSCQVQVVCEG